MRKLKVFNFITLNGFFKGAQEDISWHIHGAEENEYAVEHLISGSNTLLFGRITYEMMANYWPTPLASDNDPVIAAGMNDAVKIVFSRTLRKAEWNNTTIIRENIIEKIKKMKQTPGNDLTLLGSGSILTQLADQGLIDEYQIMIDPVVINGGMSIFKDIRRRLDLRLIRTKVFESGAVLLCYQSL